MKSYLHALKEVSSLPISLERRRPGDSASDWQLVLMRGLLGLVWGLGGALIAWLVSGEKTVGAILGTAAVCLLRNRLCAKGEGTAVVELSKWLLSNVKDQEMRGTYSSLAALGLLVLRPFCIYILLLHGVWLWLPAAALLGYAASLDCGSMIKMDQRHWLTAAGISLVLGAIISKTMPNYHGMFIFSIAASILCWLLPMVMHRFNLSFSKPSCIYICEAIALILGVAGVAM